MSSYPAPLNNSLMYNPATFIGVTDVNGVQKLTLDLSNYVRSDAGVFSSNIETLGSLIVGNETQNVAFTDNKNTLLVTTSNKVEDIAYSNNQTTIGGDCQISGNLMINDNNLSISKINGLQTKLNQIDTNSNNITSNDAKVVLLNTFKTNQEAYNSSNDNNLSTITGLNSTQNTRLDNLSTFQTSQLSYNSNNDISKLVQNGRVDDLELFKVNQETYNTTNDATLATLNNNATSQDLRLDDLESYDDINDTAILVLQNKDASQDVIINGVLTSVNNLANMDITLQSNITTNDNSISALNVSVASINTTLLNNNTSITNLDTLTSSHTASISNLDSFKTSQDIYNVANDSLTSEHTATIAQNSLDVIQNRDDIVTKHNIIDSNNRLNSNYLADGTVSNTQFQTLSGINTTASIESRFTALSNTLNSLNIDVGTLESLQNIDLTNFSNIGSDMTALQNYNISNDTNLLNATDRITTNETDISNLQINVSSNTGRLNVKDSEIASMTTSITTNITNIGQNTTDIGVLQSEMATSQGDILSKHNIIDVNNKLDCTLISTNVDATPSTLDVLLQSLTDINTTQSTSISDINTSITNVTNAILNNDSELLSLQNADMTHDALITALETNVTSFTTSLNLKQDEINVTSKLSSNLVYDANQIDTIDNIIVRIDGDIATKQNVINNTDNKLTYDKLDLTGSNLIYADYASSINSKFTLLDGQISTLTGLQDGDIVNFQTISDNFTAVDTSITTINNAITKVPFLDNVTADVQGQINGLISSSLPSITYNSGTTTTSISNNTHVSNIIFDDASIQTIAFTDAKNTSLNGNISNITTLQGQMSAVQTDVSNNAGNILLKQNIINGANRLLVSYVDLSGSNLMYADYGSSVSTKMSSIDSSFSSQSTLNTSLTNNITDLTNNKQNVLSSGNKLDPQFIQCSGAGVLTTTKTQYLSSIDADIATKFTSKADVNNTTFTGSTTLSALQMNGLITSKGISENINSTFTSFASNILTYSFTDNSILYFGGLTANTNFKMALSNVPTTTYKTQTFSLLISVATYKAYANTCSINGTDYTLIANGGLSNVSVVDVTTSGLLLQQFTIIYLNGSVYKVLTNLSQFY